MIQCEEINGLDTHIVSFRKDWLSHSRRRALTRRELVEVTGAHSYLRLDNVNAQRVAYLRDYVEHVKEHGSVDFDAEVQILDGHLASGLFNSKMTLSPYLDEMLGVRCCNGSFREIDDVITDPCIKEELQLLYVEFVRFNNNNLYQCMTRRFYRFKKLRCMSKQLSKNLRFILQLLMLARERHLTFEQVWSCFNCFEYCFQGFVVPGVCPGFVLHGPPFVGKTSLALCYLSIFDVENLNKDALAQDSQIITRLVQSGISLLTNRWEYLDWKCLVVSLKPRNLKKCLKQANIYPRKMTWTEFQKSKRAFFCDKPLISRNKPGLVRRDTWLYNLKNLSELPQIWLKKNQFATDGMEKFLRYVLNHCYADSSYASSSDEEFEDY